MLDPHACLQYRKNQQCVLQRHEEAHAICSPSSPSACGEPSHVLRAHWVLRTPVFASRLEAPADKARAQFPYRPGGKAGQLKLAVHALVRSWVTLTIHTDTARPQQSMQRRAQHSVPHRALHLHTVSGLQGLFKDGSVWRREACAHRAAPGFLSMHAGSLDRQA